MAAGGGGSWKVAYADFVTAMMALFMVLWILGQDQEVKGKVEEYFKNPWQAALSDSTGIIPIKNADVLSSRKANFEAPSAVPLETVRRINEDLMKLFMETPEVRENRSITVETTPEGMLITFMDQPNQPIFEKDAPEFTPYGAWVFNTVALQIARYPKQEIEVEGHIEKGYKPAGQDRGIELATERANVARRRLIENQVGASQIFKVAGYPGTKPLKGKPPENPENQRVTILIRATGGEAG